MAGIIPLSANNLPPSTTPATSELAPSPQNATTIQQQQLEGAALRTSGRCTSEVSLTTSGSRGYLSSAQTSRSNSNYYCINSDDADASSNDNHESWFLPSPPVIIDSPSTTTAELCELCFGADFSLDTTATTTTMADDEEEVEKEEREFAVHTPLAQSPRNSQKSLEQYLTASRVGRDLQRWDSVHGSDKPNCRLTTGCIPILKDGRILLISSTKSKIHFVLPKGGWEQDETLSTSALRETLEEAGVTGTLGPPLPSLTYETRKAEQRRILLSQELSDAAAVSANESLDNGNTGDEAKPRNPRKEIRQSHQYQHTHNRMTLFPLYVQEVYDTWPEMQRLRRAVTMEEALVLLQHRPEFVTIMASLQLEQQRQSGSR